MTKFRKLLDTSSDKKSKAENDAIRKTGVTFKIDGKKVAVSLESMVYSSPVRGSIRERLLESLGLVAARADEMPNIPNDAIVKRNYFGDGRHLTWGRLMGMGANPDVKSKARKQFETDPAKEAIKAELEPEKPKDAVKAQTKPEPAAAAVPDSGAPSAERKTGPEAEKTEEKK